MQDNSGQLKYTIAKNVALALPLISCIAIVFFPIKGDAKFSKLPSELRLRILCKVLVYDRNFPKNKTAVRVGVFFHKDNKKSEADAKDTYAKFKSFKDVRVSGLKLQPALLDVSEGSNIESLIKKNKINLIYLASQLQELVPLFKSFAEKNKMLLVGGEPDYVYHGASVVVVKKNKKPKICIHLEEAKKQGADFIAHLLSLSEIIH